MGYRTIAVIVQNTENARRVLDCAVPLAEAWDAHLIGIHAEAIPAAYTDAVGFPDVGIIEAATEAADERERDVESLFAARMARTKQTHDWQSMRGVAGDGAFSGAEIARSADIVIVAQRNPQAGSNGASSIDGAIYESGRPVLVIPFSGTVPTTFQRVLVSWNGSREAARAAFDALPLIASAEATEILVVDPPKGGEVGVGASTLAAALARHGAKVNVTTETSNGSSVEEVVRDRIAATGADLLVMGAYSHSWLRDLLFGGVTKTVLQSMEIPTFMSR